MTAATRARSSGRPAGTLHETVAARLRRAKQRVTANREAIVAALAAAGRPVTTPEILDAPSGRGLAQSSVYRNLLVLEEAGLVHRIVTDGEFARYELAEDLTEHHHHLVCANCGLVDDVPAAAGLEESVETAASQIARSTGFRTERHRVDLVGLCARCA
jgi:Fur family transcriptional regulator, ferric uptake regulator